MKPVKIIYGIAGVSVLFVISVLSVTHRDNLAIEKSAVQLTNLSPRSEIQAEPDNFTRVSREVIAEVYGIAPKGLGSSRVLGASSPPTAEPLIAEQISDIATPGVVRVINHMTGTIQTPDFNIDLANVKVVPLNKTYTEKVDSEATGTGFFINSQGNILTNAHVVSTDLALNVFIANALIYYGKNLQSMILEMNPENRMALENTLQTKYGSNPDEAAAALAADLKKIVADFIIKNATISVQQQLVILDPSNKGVQIQTKKDLADLIDESIPATIVAINRDYERSHHDVALLKIEENKTPGLALFPENTISSGQKIYVFGFPGNAAIDKSDFFTSTMTQGSIGAVKDLDGVKVYQTDAKISPGSSGGPVFNEEGKVIALMTYSTQGATGDGFAFAIPVQYGVDIIKNNQISTEESLYATNYIEGLLLAKEQLCRKANTSFNLAKNTNPKFDAGPQIQKYITKCDSVIAAGNSLDSNWDKAMHWVKNIPAYAWAGGVAIMGIIVAAWFFLKKYKITRPRLINTNQLAPP
jgi:S1-C subfamily serine protease